MSDALEVATPQDKTAMDILRFIICEERADVEGIVPMKGSDHKLDEYE